MHFLYQARYKSGELMNGAMAAANKVDVIRQLEHAGYAVISIKEAVQNPLAQLFGLFRKIDRQEVIVFTRQLATMLRTGLPLLQSLDTISEQTVNPVFQNVVNKVKAQVQGGKSFSAALAEHPAVFPEMFISMVRVGEAAGILDDILNRLAVLGAQELEMTSRVRSAFIYPAVLMGVSFLIVNFLFIAVLPKFVVVFDSSKMELPLPTQIVLGISWVFRKFWLAGVVLFAAGGYLLHEYLKTNRGRLHADGLFLKIPIFGMLFRKIMIARFARTLAALTSAGIPLVQALEVVERTVSNLVFRKVLRRIQTSLREGSTLVEPFQMSGFFTPMVLQMISSGEKSGKLDESLGEIASFYEPEIEYTVKNLTTLLEPIMLVFMGGVVAFICLSVLLPIFNLMKSFKG